MSIPNTIEIWKSKVYSNQFVELNLNQRRSFHAPLRLAHTSFKPSNFRRRGFDGETKHLYVTMKEKQ